MARASGVTTEQLRRWDRLGDLPAQRLGAVDPSKADTPAGNWRVYPRTQGMIERIRTLAADKAERRTGMSDQEFPRTAAARVLDVSAKSLKRWERMGVARPVWRDGRPIYTAEEIRRLAPRSPRYEP